MSRRVCTVTGMKPVADPKIAEALDQFSIAVAELSDAVDAGELSDRDARLLVREVEQSKRKMSSTVLRVQTVVDDRGLYAADGHPSAKVMVRHEANLSHAEAARRAAMVRALGKLDRVRDAFDRGRIGECQVGRIARVYANPRVRDRLVDEQAQVRCIGQTRNLRPVRSGRVAMGAPRRRGRHSRHQDRQRHAGPHRPQTVSRCPPQSPARLRRHHLD